MKEFPVNLYFDCSLIINWKIIDFLKLNLKHFCLYSRIRSYYSFLVVKLDYFVVIVIDTDLVRDPEFLIIIDFIDFRIIAKNCLNSGSNFISCC